MQLPFRSFTSSQRPRLAENPLPAVSATERSGAAGFLRPMEQVLKMMP